MTNRDPRIDPQPGDVVLCGRLHLTVTLVARSAVQYELRNPGGRGVYAIPLKCSASKKEWRERVAKDAEVLHAEGV